MPRTITTFHADGQVTRRVVTREEELERLRSEIRELEDKLERRRRRNPLGFLGFLDPTCGLHSAAREGLRLDALRRELARKEEETR